MKSNEYSLNTESNMIDDEGNIILDTIISNDDEDHDILETSVI